MWGRIRTTSNEMNPTSRASRKSQVREVHEIKASILNSNGIDDVVVFVLLIMLSRYIMSPWKDIPHEDKAASHGSKGLIRLTLEINGMSHVIQRPSIQVPRTKVWPSGFNFQQPNPLLCYLVVCTTRLQIPFLFFTSQKTNLTLFSMASCAWLMLYSSVHKLHSSWIWR